MTDPRRYDQEDPEHLSPEAYALSLVAAEALRRDRVDALANLERYLAGDLTCACRVRRVGGRLVRDEGACSCSRMQVEQTEHGPRLRPIEARADEQPNERSAPMTTTKTDATEGVIDRAKATQATWARDAHLARQPVTRFDFLHDEVKRVLANSRPSRAELQRLSAVVAGHRAEAAATATRRVEAGGASLGTLELDKAQAELEAALAELDGDDETAEPDEGDARTDGREVQVLDRAQEPDGPIAQAKRKQHEAARDAWKTTNAPPLHK